MNFPEAKTLTPLKRLPGFDDAMAIANSENDRRREQGYLGYPLELVGEVVIPSLKRISSWVMLDAIALQLLSAQLDEERRLRLVPPPRPVAANDCEAQ